MQTRWKPDHDPLYSCTLDIPAGGMHVAPMDMVGLSVVFLNIFDRGRAYTEGEHRTWLTAGFAEIERSPLPEGVST